MRLVRTSVQLGLALSSLALLTACDQPKPRGPAANAPAAAPAPAQAAQNTEPAPAAPAWAVALIGKPLKEAFPGADVSCVGNTDNVVNRYQGASPGVKIVGWGWDPAAKAAVQRVVLVDADARIVGAGETGAPRPDVTAARPDITSPTTGWTAVTAKTSGPVDAYGIIGDGKSLCRLGHLEI
jgi:hypothetical protein